MMIHVCIQIEHIVSRHKQIDAGMHDLESQIIYRSCIAIATANAGFDVEICFQVHMLPPPAMPPLAIVPRVLLAMIQPRMHHLFRMFGCNAFSTSLTHAFLTE